MANNYRHSGRRLPVATASGTIASGDLVIQEGLVGVALVDAASGASLWIGAEGVWVLPVPSSTAKGDRLHLDGAVTSTDAIAPTMIRTGAGAGDTLIGIALSDRDAAGNALVLLAPQGQAAI